MTGKTKGARYRVQKRSGPLPWHVEDTQARDFERMVRRYPTRRQAARHVAMLGGDLSVAPDWYEGLVQHAKKRMSLTDAYGYAAGSAREVGLDPGIVQADPETGAPLGGPALAGGSGGAKRNPDGGARGGSVVAERRRLRAEVMQRRREVLPKLRKALAAAKRARATRLRECKAIATERRRRVQRASVQLERELRRRIDATKKKAQAAAKQCSVRATRDGTETLEAALAALEAERQQIAELQRRAAALRSQRGRKGGQRAAELRAESDDRVRDEIGNDPILVAVWERLKGKIRATKHMSRSEAFFEHLHKHPELLDEQRAQLENKWETEAAALLGQGGRMPAQPDELHDCLSMLDKCEQHCASQGAPVPF